MSQPTRVLVVEDSLTVRRHIVEVLGNTTEFEVVGEAADGRRAIELCEALRPDVVTMDMMLPVMTGLAATEYIMAYCPTPILIVSSSLNRGEVFKTYEALAAGAVDVIEKTSSPDNVWEKRLMSAIRVVSRVRVITHPRGRLNQVVHRPARRAAQEGGSPLVIAIGASTGGPAALVTLLGALPADFALPLLVVLHIAEPFGQAMANWLDGLCSLQVRCAVDGEALPEGGSVLLAPPGHHLRLAGGKLFLSEGAPRHSCRPSVDVLFESLAMELGPRAVGCLLTGMGRDGAAGLLAMAQSGALTIAQDEASSVIFGMPGAAISLGAARRVLPLGRMAATFVELAAAAGGSE